MTILVISSSPLLLTGALDTAQILFRNFTPKRHRVSERLAQGPYVWDRAGVEPMTLRAKGVDSTKAPHAPDNCPGINVRINRKA